MKKYLITVLLLVSFYLSSFTQTPREITLQRKMDSLKRVAPGLKGIAKVDALNTIVDIYQILDDENQMQVDSATPYAKLSLNEAKRIGYKRGLGYAYLKMSYCDILRAEIYIRKNPKYEPGYLNPIEQQITQAMQIGEELNDNIMIGSDYVLLGRLGRLKGDKDQSINLKKKAIALFERPATQQPPGTYREMYHPDCIGCNGNEFRLAEHYMELNNSEKDYDLSIEYLNKAILNYQKSGAKSEMGNAYMAIGNKITLASNFEAGIEYFKKASLYFHEDGNENRELSSYINLCAIYWNLGDFENGLEYSKKSVQLAEKIEKNNRTIITNNLRGQTFYWMGRFYSIGGDYETALIYLRKAHDYNPVNNPGMNDVLAAEMGEVNRLKGNYDSAMFYLAPFETKADAPPIGKSYLGRLYISRKQYDKALPLTNEVIETAIKNNNIGNLGLNYTDIAKIWLGKKEYQTALNNARAGFTLLAKTKRNVRLIDNYQVLSEIFNKMGNNDSAYFYLKQYTALKDSLINRQFYKRLNDYKKEAEDAKKIGQIKLLQKDNLIKEQDLLKQVLLQQKSEAELVLLDQGNEIKDKQLLIKDQSLKEQTLLKEQNQSQLALFDKENKLKDQRLKQQAFLRNALLGGLLLFILLGVFVFRTLSLKRKNEKLRMQQHLEVQQLASEKKQVELEMQALRAQMNPHFIFNCLSSINRFILKNESKIASNYLTRFSRLIRMVLNNSQKPLISLDDELEMLELYLEMERLRFKNSFDYAITFLNAIDSDNVFIPPLLLQPFCENAIWHGLMHKEGQGRLDIELSMQDNILNCVITDNGVGREKAEEMNSKTAEKEKSMGLKITTERLALLNREKGLHTFYEIEDLKDENENTAGTKIILKISFKEPEELIISAQRT